jgi:hypothetical protein
MMRGYVNKTMWSGNATEAQRCRADRRLKAKQDSCEDEPRCREDRYEKTELSCARRFVPGNCATQRALRHLEVACMHDQAERHHEDCKIGKQH